MLTHQEERIKSAAYLNTLGADALFKRFEITRIARIDGLDIIGVPVYSSVRPASRSISVNSGKSRDRLIARAGSIAEAAEFYTFEQHPKEFPEGLIGYDPGFPTRKDSTWTPETSVILEEVTHYASGNKVKFPAELVWMTRREDQNNFMRSTTGQAIGYSFEDAFLQGIYEVVERDQATLRRTSLVRLGIHPPRVEFPPRLSKIAEKISQASLKLYLLYCSSDIKIPVYWTILVDPYGGAGAYFGYGAHVDHEVAAERAILECIQGRAVYISGARDDILRRDFLKQRETDPKVIMDELDRLPIHPFPERSNWFDLFYGEWSLAEELSSVLERIEPWRDRIYYKHIDLGDMHAVKTLIFGLECPSIVEEDIWRETRWTKLRESFMPAPVSTG